MRKDDRAKQNLFHAREWNKSAPSEAFESEIIFEEAKHCLGIRLISKAFYAFFEIPNFNLSELIAF